MRNKMMSGSEITHAKETAAAAANRNDEAVDTQKSGKAAKSKPVAGKGVFPKGKTMAVRNAKGGVNGAQEGKNPTTAAKSTMAFKGDRSPAQPRQRVA